jgi:hypothetical protein
MDLPVSVLEEIRLLVRCGYANRMQVCESILDLSWEELGMIAEPIPTQPDAVMIVADHPTNAAISERLRGAIDEAFSRKAEEQNSWPAVTDCDRLRSAFDVLDKQGIVTLENAGFTQQEGGSMAAELAVARDSLGAESRGFCFFTRQDTLAAAEGGGLLLTFGSYQEDPPQPPAAPPASCPICNGRGWLPQSDPTQFPELCACRKQAAAPIAVPLPAKTATQKVGEAVVAACRQAGLNVEWSGAANARIELSPFRWQRRIVAPSAADLEDFIASWELELRAGSASDSELTTELEERAGDWFADFSDFGPALLHRLRDHTERFVEAERQREATWNERTVNDRIDAAFEALRSRGVFAFAGIATSIQDGWAFVGVNASAEARGAVFFHQEDVLDGVGGAGIYLAFGTFEGDSAENDAASLALGHETVSELETQGVATEWSGSVRDRIRVLPFEWKKRRWTKAPAHLPAPLRPRNPQPLAQPPESETHATRVELRKRFVAHGFATLVKARRTTAGFDLRLSSKMRAAWQSLGTTEPGQVCHLGAPHTFVRAGEHTALAALSALENLREEAMVLRERGITAVGAEAE